MIFVFKDALGPKSRHSNDRRPQNTDNNCLQSTRIGNLIAPDQVRYV